MRTQLSTVLRGIRTDSLDWQPLLDGFIAGLRALDIGATAPKAGTIFPDFALPDSRGRLVTLCDLLMTGPVVLSFNRGGWCPFCRHELEAWNAQLHRLEALGARLVVVVAETGGRAANIGRIFSGHATILCDVDHGLALTSGLAFHYGQPMLERYKAVGLDLAQLYGSVAGLLPVPATFVIDRQGVVRHAFADVDFRLRAEPDDVIEAVEGLG